MTTLAEMTLRVAREVTDVMDGEATSGTTTTLTDSENLYQPSAYWRNGLLFFLSGTYAGTTKRIEDYSNSVFTFSALASAVAAGMRYAVMQSVYPRRQIISAINMALESTHVTGYDETLTGDGATLSFALPADVYNIKRVEFLRVTETLLSTHWREDYGKLRFADGYAPALGDSVRIVYRKRPTLLTADTDVLNTEIEEAWLKYKAVEALLWWGVGIYGNTPEHRIEERMNKTINALKGKFPRRDAPDFVMNTGGWQ